MITEKPFAKCTKCGENTLNPILINERCHNSLKKHISGKIKIERCRGVYRSMLSEKDWKKCPNCFTENAECKVCRGISWVNNRPPLNV